MRSSPRRKRKAPVSVFYSATVYLWRGDRLAADRLITGGLAESKKHLIFGGLGVANRIVPVSGNGDAGKGGLIAMTTTRTADALV